MVGRPGTDKDKGMTRRRRLLCVILTLTLAACSEAETAEGQGGIVGTDGVASGVWGVDDVATREALSPEEGTSSGALDAGPARSDAQGASLEGDGAGPEAPPSQGDVSAWSPPPTPAIAVDPMIHTFSYISPLTNAMVRQINIGNMGQSPLHVDAIEFASNSSSDFAWVLKPTTPKTLAPGKWTMFEVRFACDIIGGPCKGDDGFIEVMSDDPETPVTTITLKSQVKGAVAQPEPCGLLNPTSLNFGQVTRGEFKTMSATLTNCSTEEALTVNKVTRSSFLFMSLTQEFQMDLEGQTPVTLGPGESLPIEVTYTPQLAGADAGYFVLQTDDATTPNMQLDVSAVGVSPPPEEIGLAIRLSWDTDETDVDSHFIAPGGSFFHCDLDCHYQNPSPDWGVQGDWSDDPFLDVDDVDGYGPENVNISAPQPGVYTFIVHYYDDTYDFSSPTASNATVEILSYGVVTHTFGPEYLQGTNWNWDVFEVEWPPVNGTLNVTTLGNVYQVSQSQIKSCGSLFP